MKKLILNILMIVLLCFLLVKAKCELISFDPVNLKVVVKLTEDFHIDGNDVNTVESVPNPYFSNHHPGEVPGFINSLGADVMLSGGMGGRAVAFFQSFGITPATGASGTARDALTNFLSGNLNSTAACAESIQHGH